MNEHVIPLDIGPFETSTTERTIQRLIGPENGFTSCDIRCIYTPPLEGSPSGLHVHEVDQIFYIIRGTMSLEVSDRRYTAGPGSLVAFPAGVPHRNWNAGTEPTFHIAINAPARQPG